MALDSRRRNYPLPPIDKTGDRKLVTSRGIVPEKQLYASPHVKDVGLRDLPLNRLVGRVGHPYLWYITATKFNTGGVSSQFGSRVTRGAGLGKNERLIFGHDFATQGAPDNLIAATGAQVGDGFEFTNNSGGSNFGFTFDLTGLPAQAKMHASVQKVSGTFVNWEGNFDAGISNMTPGETDIGHREIISSRIFQDSTDGAYGINGVTTVGLGDIFICHWFIVTSQSSKDPGIDSRVRGNNI